MRGARALLLLAALLPLLLFAPPASAHGGGPVFVFLMDVGFEEAVKDGMLRSIASTGGMGLLAETEPVNDVIADLSATRAHGDVTLVRMDPPHIANQLAALLPTGLAGESAAPEILVLAFSVSASPGAGVVVMGHGTPSDLFRNRGPVPGLTSDTTGRQGLVSNVDLVATVLDYVGHPDPAVSGNPIRAEGSAPTELHDLYAQYRRVVTPVGLAVLGLALVALGAALAIVLGAWTPSPGVGRAVAGFGLFAVSLHVAMLPASWLPTYSWPVVVVLLVGVAAVVAALAWWSGRRSSQVAAATVAAAGLVLVIVDGLLGWRSLLTPLLGGSALEGGRFYGLGNSYAGLLLAGAVLLAALPRPWIGVVILVAAALFAGSPWTGADLGGGVTLFVAAAIWWALAVRRRVRFLEVVVVVGTAVIGAALLVALHGLVAEPSHVTRAVQEAGGVAGVAGTFWHRLRLNLEVTARTPVVWPALAGVMVATVAAWRRWPGIDLAFRGPSSWRPAVLTLGLGALAGYLLNDTYGLTAVAFIYLTLALVYPAALEKMFGRNGKKP